MEQLSSIARISNNLTEAVDSVLDEPPLKITKVKSDPKAGTFDDLKQMIDFLQIQVQLDKTYPMKLHRDDIWKKALGFYKMVIARPEMLFFNFEVIIHAVFFSKYKHLQCFFHNNSVL